MAPFLVGRTTSDLTVDEEDAKCGRDESAAAGETERLRVVVGRPFPFFLKNGTLTVPSVDAISVICSAKKVADDVG